VSTTIQNSCHSRRESVIAVPRRELVTCPVCASSSINGVADLYDDRYGYPGTFQLFLCRACGHRFLGGARFSDEEIRSLYSDYYPRRHLREADWRPHSQRNGFNAWLDGARASAFRWVPGNVRVLDIGCGFGQSLGYHANRGCEVWGVESDENVKRIAEYRGFKVRIGVFDSADFPADYFDVVTLDQVIEHMRDPAATMAGVRTVLKPGGIAILSTPNPGGSGARLFGRRWINWHAPYHLHFFSRRSMKITAERAGLDCRSLGTITPSEWLRYQWIHLATRKDPKQASPFWSGKGGYTLAERIALKAVSLLHRSRINHLLTRVFDTVGVGDSQLFILKREK
jgi:2-polyprenyl-3-methyl-5-hydroxy-6-metoxy-1,4-benzoquinol methylase